MTPKEKAKQIYDKMYIEHDLHDFDYCNQCAKEHSLILIDELLSVLDNPDIYLFSMKGMSSVLFYREVLKEAQKL